MHWDERKTFQETVLCAALASWRDRPRSSPWNLTRANGSTQRPRAAGPGKKDRSGHYEYLQVAVADVQHDIDAMVALLHRITDRRGTSNRPWAGSRPPAQPSTIAC